MLKLLVRLTGRAGNWPDKWHIVEIDRLSAALADDIVGPHPASTPPTHLCTQPARGRYDDGGFQESRRPSLSI